MITYFYSEPLICQALDIMNTTSFSQTGLLTKHLNCLPVHMKLLLTGRDDEGDQVVLTSDEQFQELLRLSFEAQSAVLHLQLSVLSSVPAIDSVVVDDAIATKQQVDGGFDKTANCNTTSFFEVAKTIGEHPHTPLISIFCLGVVASVLFCAKAKRSS